MTAKQFEKNYKRLTGTEINVLNKENQPETQEG